MIDPIKHVRDFIISMHRTYPGATNPKWEAGDDIGMLTSQADNMLCGYQIHITDLERADARAETALRAVERDRDRAHEALERVDADRGRAWARVRELEARVAQLRAALGKLRQQAVPSRNMSCDVVYGICDAALAKADAQKETT